MRILGSTTVGVVGLMVTGICAVSFISSRGKATKNRELFGGRGEVGGRGVWRGHPGGGAGGRGTAVFVLVRARRRATP
jgi:hypothetical protein